MQSPREKITKKPLAPILFSRAIHAIISFKRISGMEHDELKRIVAAIGVLIVLLILPGCASKGQRAKRINNQGVDLYQKNNYGSARERFEKAVALDPNNADAHYNLGLIYFGDRQLEKAVVQYKKAIAIDPKHANARLNLGIALAQAGSFDQAVTEYQEAIKVKPDFAEAYNNLAVAQENRGKLEEAKKDYRKAVQIKPDYFEATYNLALIHQKEKDYREAVKIFTVAATIKPKEPYVSYNLACCFARIGERDNAFSALDSCIDNGFEYIEIIEKYSPDLASLKGDPRFKALIDKMKKQRGRK
jgi:Tfp pilus assembly protein PilF